MKNKLTILFLLLHVYMLHAINVYTLPENVNGIKNPITSLNGTWQFQFSPQDKWENVTVPGELSMQGYAIKHNQIYKYQKEISIPKDFQGKVVILRFDGVYSYAKLWINDKFISEHYGGFTRWENDITSHILFNQKNKITLEISDLKDDISYGSGYAHHPIGGILRDVSLYAIPHNYITNFNVQTQLNEHYSNATLNIEYTLSNNSDIEYSLTSPDGQVVNMSKNIFHGHKGGNINKISLQDPVLWDAEHPNLYKLKVKIKNRRDSYSFTQEIGIREIIIKEKQVLVNGKPIKLRGANRHDVHPLLGRTTTVKLDSLDAVLLKNANMNFVRTSHYPPSENFIRFCNRIGLYVECETAVCFIDNGRNNEYAPANFQNDTLYTSKYLSQLKEMILSYRTHPSILMWSIGNESIYGKNFQESYDLTKKMDPTRPVIFSYPGTVDKEQKAFDIVSMHYPGCDGNMNQKNYSVSNFQDATKPVLFDEWAHLPCYTYETLQTDPNIRDFWGITINKLWENIFDTEGGLGGAIWCFVDDVFMLPKQTKGDPWWKRLKEANKPQNIHGSATGYGEWGVVDIWRRKKPEFWNAQKAYSPIRVLKTNFSNYYENSNIILPIYNRFDHTNLKEIIIKVSYKDKTKTISTNIPPHTKGLLVVPNMGWKSEDSFIIEFLYRNGNIIDIEHITLGNRKECPINFIDSHSEKLQIVDNARYLIIKGKHFNIPINKSTGLMEFATSNGDTIIDKGPLLHMNLIPNHKTIFLPNENKEKVTINQDEWKLKNLIYKKVENDINIEIDGCYKNIQLSIQMNISPTGIIDFTYFTEGEKHGWIKESGLKFYVSDSFNQLSWKRSGFWTYYPQWAYSGTEGQIELYNKHFTPYRNEPQSSWNLDTHNYFYYGDKGSYINNPLTNQAKGMKENIYMYKLDSPNSSLIVLSQNADLSCRINKNINNQLILYINNQCDYPELLFWNYSRFLDSSPIYGRIRIKF